jgi:hypothetical protein
MLERHLATFSHRGRREYGAFDANAAKHRMSPKEIVTPAKAGVQLQLEAAMKLKLDSGIRRNDKEKKRGRDYRGEKGVI